MEALMRACKGLLVSSSRCVMFSFKVRVMNLLADHSLMPMAARIALALFFSFLDQGSSVPKRATIKAIIITTNRTFFLLTTTRIRTFIQGNT